MLNNWSTTPLLLAGLWSPPTPLVHEAVVQGVDAALCFTDEDETLQPIKQKVKNLGMTSMPKVDEDLAFRLILESDRNVPSGMLVPLESPSVSIPPATESPIESRLSQSLPPTSVIECPENVDPQAVIVTRLRLKNNSRGPSRAPSPAIEDIKPDVAPVRSLPATPPQTLAEELAAVDNVADDVVVGETDAEEEASTFEDLLENYSNLNIGAGHTVTKSPELSPAETPIVHSPPTVTRESSPEFEIISGKLLN